MTAIFKLGPRKLDKSPFASEPETRQFFEGAVQREALARLRFLRANHRLGLVLGERGVGKSLVLRVFQRQCRRQGFAAALVNLSGLSTREFYWQVTSQLGAPVRGEDNLGRLFRQAADQIAANRLQDMSTVILLDDVHGASADLLPEITRLTQLDVTRGSLSLVLAVSSGQESRLGAPLRELVDLRVDLEPWDELDTTGYLQMAQVRAGCERLLFDNASLSEIHHLSGGVPRQVNRLAEHALSMSAGALIDSSTIRAAHAELAKQARE